MTAPADQHALREALAQSMYDHDAMHLGPLWTWDQANEKERAEYLACADALIAGPLAPYLAAEDERDAAVSKAALDENAAAAWKRKAQEAECTINDLAGIDQRAAEYCRERDAAEARALAAEAESTRLKETVEAARAALKPFAEAINKREQRVAEGAAAGAWIASADADWANIELGDLRAARSVLATIPPKENPDA